MFLLDKRFLNFFIIIFLTISTFFWTFFIFHLPIIWNIILIVIFLRVLASLLLFKDYSLSWSKVTQKTFLLKSIVYVVAFFVYMPIFYGDIWVYFFMSELFLFLFAINFLMYGYYYYTNKNRNNRNKSVVIYGAGKAGSKLESELRETEYRLKFFIDDNKKLQTRSIDAIRILSVSAFKAKMQKQPKVKKFNLLVIAMPSVDKATIQKIYNQMSPYFDEVKILPSLGNILNNVDFSKQLKDISVEDLLARHPQDLDKKLIQKSIQNKTILITGAGGSIGSELSRQCASYQAKKLILLDHSEFNLYKISEDLNDYKPELVLQNVLDIKNIERTFKKYKIDLVLHAAAYKHVPLSEDNISEVLTNNIQGTKNLIDLSIKHKVKKFVLISTDKAVRPTNVMGASKRVCELYAQNSNYKNKTEVLVVRFGNVLGSSGSVIPKFRKQLEKGGPLTVTHPEITRYFMLIPEACELVLQAASLGKGSEIFILDMGEPVRIIDLAKKMIRLSGKKNIEIKFTGLRPGEKLYEELLIDNSEQKTVYRSITIAGKTQYNIKTLNQDIAILLASPKPLSKLKKIVPEFDHKKNR